MPYTYNTTKYPEELVKIQVKPKDGDKKTSNSKPPTTDTASVSVFGALASPASSEGTLGTLERASDLLNNEYNPDDKTKIKTSGSVSADKAKLSGDVQRECGDGVTLYLRGKAEAELSDANNELRINGYGSTESSVSTGVEYKPGESTTLTAEVAAFHSNRVATTKTGTMEEKTDKVQINLGARTGFSDENDDFSARIDGSFGYSDTKHTIGGRKSEGASDFASLTAGFEYSRKLVDEDGFKLRAITNGNFSYLQDATKENTLASTSVGLQFSGGNKDKSFSYDGKITADAYGQKLTAGKTASAKSVGGTAALNLRWNPNDKVSFHGGAAARSYTLSGSPDLLPAQSGFTASANVGVDYKVNDDFTLGADISTKLSHNGCRSSEVGLSANWKNLSLKGAMNSESGPSVALEYRITL